MGLAPYGTPRFCDVIRDRLVEIADDGSIWLDMAYFDYGTRHDDDLPVIARAVRRAAAATRGAHHRQGDGSRRVDPGGVRRGGAAHRPPRPRAVPAARDLVMAGGVALNCVANGRLLREGPFEDVWIQPAAGDAGGAVGAALLVWHHHMKQPRQPRRPDAQQASLLGPAFDPDEIELFLDGMGAAYERMNDEAALLRARCRPARGGEGDRLVPGPDGVRSARARLPQHHRRSAVAAHAAEDERKNQVPRVVPAVRTVRAAGACERDTSTCAAGQESPYMLMVAPVRPA